MQNVLEMYTKLETEAKTKAVQEVRFLKAFSVGETVRQGDLYLWAVEKTWAKGKKLKDRQVVPGHSKGSSHTVSESVEVYEGIQAPEAWREKMRKFYPHLSLSVLERELLGPVCFFGVRDLLRHVEHAFVSIPGKTWIQTMYQLNPRTLKRAED